MDLEHALSFRNGIQIFAKETQEHFYNLNL